jgi:hypothetical protein
MSATQSISGQSPMQSWGRVWAGLWFCFWLWLGMAVQPAQAHSSSNSLLELTSESSGGFQLRADLPLRDVALRFGMDADRNGEVNWSEVLTRQEPVERWVRAGLTLQNDRGPCQLGPMDWAISRYGDEVFLSLQSQVRCDPARQSDSTVLRYQLLFDQDSLHRALFKVQTNDGMASGILSPERNEQWLSPKRHGFLGVLWSYLIEGVWHIWIGADHIAFLLSLLLPSVLLARDQGFGQWKAQPRLSASLRQVLTVVTAFTLAHSVTLGLAAFELVRLPGPWVEAAIAVSVVVAALNNLVSRQLGFRWQMAFAFGLIHGFGFASVLGDLGLPAGQGLAGLLGFNLGVELGQLAIVGLWFPVAWRLRHTRAYQWGLMVVGCGCIAFLGLYWLIERLA